LRPVPDMLNASPAPSVRVVGLIAAAPHRRKRMIRLRWRPSRWLGLSILPLTLSCAPSRGAAEAPATAPAAVAAKPAARPVRVIHAWRDFLSYWDSLPAEQKAAAERDEK